MRAEFSTRILLLSLFGLLFVGCATLSPGTKEFVLDSKHPASIRLPQVPFYTQPDGDCGPVALAMILETYGLHESPEFLKKRLVTPVKKGTLPTELMAYPRDLGMMSLPVSNFKEMAMELEKGHPVIVLLNQGMQWIPVWHYAVVVGFDKDKQVFYLHSGEEKFSPLPMTHLERYWKLASNWGMVLGWPGETFPSGSELEHMTAASNLERQGKIESAQKAYQSILKKWPQSLSALIGLGNIAFKEKDYLRSVRVLEKASLLHPESKAAKNNLAVARYYLNKKKAKKPPLKN